MNSPFNASFDDLLNNILTDYQNQSYVDAQGVQCQVDISKGSLAFMKSACMASALWGIHRSIAWTGDQIFPDSCTQENLYHHGAINGVAPLARETAAAYLVRVQEVEQRPLAGGNRYDYEKWAKDIAGCVWSKCYPIARGNGTVDLLIMADILSTGSQIPSSHSESGTVTTLTVGKLIDAAGTFLAPLPVRPLDVVRNTTRGTSAVVTTVDSGTQLTIDQDIFTHIGDVYVVDSLCTRVKTYIDSLRPVGRGADALQVKGPTVDLVHVTMSNLGDATPDQVAAAITNYLATFIPDQILYVVQLKAIAITYGAIDPVVSLPVANVAPGSYHMFRPGVINVAP
ncbi:MAG: baseplate J/gp47 family protein [Geobacteraceae bacterium]|nr:baseplate J/gp47 family protein [Geobacteraceae bacterium]